MDFTPAASPIDVSSRNYSNSGGANASSESSYGDESSYGVGEGVSSGTRTTATSGISSSQYKLAHTVIGQTGKGTQTLPAACGSSGSSDSIEFRSACTGSIASAVGQEINADEAPSEVTALSASANRQTVSAEKLKTEKLKTVTYSTLSPRGENTSSQREGNWKFFGTSVNQNLKVDDVVEKIDSGHLWVVNSRRRNGIIVMREFHAEFAGPGAAVGGDLDSGIVKIIPIGNLSLLEPDSHEEHQNAIKIRLQWIRLTQNFTDQASPDDRARMILEQFKTYFDQATVDLVPDEAFAMLVGVLPQTIHRVRSGFVW